MEDAPSPKSFFQEPAIHKVLEYFSIHKYWFVVSTVTCILLTYVYLQHSQAAYQISAVLNFTTAKSGMPVSERGLAIYLKELNKPAFVNQAASKHIQLKLHNDAVAYNADTLTIPFPKSYNVSPGFEPGSVALTLQDTLINRGTSLMEELVKPYVADPDTTLTNSKSISQIDDSLRMLAHQLINLNATPGKHVNLEPVKQIKTALLISQNIEQQKAALNVISIYLNKPLYNFVLLPGSYSPKDFKLQHLIEQFNQLQIKKQTLLSDMPADDTKGSATLANLAKVKTEITNYINNQLQLYQSYKSKSAFVNQNPVRKAFPISTSLNIDEAKSELLNKINILQSRVDRMLVSRATLNPITAHCSALNISAVQPHAPLLYCASVLFGLLLPALVLFAINRQMK